MAASKKSASRKSAAKKARKPRKAAKRKAAKKASTPRKRQAAKKKVAAKRKNRPAVKKAPAPRRRPAVAALPTTEIDQRIAIVRNNLRDLVEQAAASAGAAGEELMSQRIAEQEAKLAALIKQREELSSGGS